MFLELTALEVCAWFACWAVVCVALRLAGLPGLALDAIHTQGMAGHRVLGQCLAEPQALSARPAECWADSQSP